MSLPYSYATSAGSLTTIPSAPLLPLHSGSMTASFHSLRSDPVLSYIATHLQLASLGTPLRPLASSEGSGPLNADMQRWEVGWESIEIERPLGQGSFGWVYLGRWNETMVAVKVLISREAMEDGAMALPPEVMQRMQEEASTMAHARHENVVNFMGICRLPPCILTEYCARGSLYDVLRRGRRDAEAAAQLTWRRRLGMALDAATGMLYLHGRGVIHRDVKSPNLLVDDNWRVKVADFNLSRVVRPMQSVASTTGGGGANNPTWLAPEVLEGRPAGKAADVYAFGLVMWELLTWQLPWTGQPAYMVVQLVIQGGRPEVPGPSQMPGPDDPATAASTAGQLETYLALMRECWEQSHLDCPAFADIVPRLRALLSGS